MPGKYTERNLISFQQSFPDSVTCAKHLAQQRWDDGYECPRCKHGEGWFLTRRQLFVCCVKFQRRILKYGSKN